MCSAQIEPQILELLCTFSRPSREEGTISNVSLVFEVNRHCCYLRKSINMLLKVKFKTQQQFVRVTEPTLNSFLNNAFLKFGVREALYHMAKLFYETGTELDEDVFEEVLKQPNIGVLLLVLDGDAQDESAIKQKMQVTFQYRQRFIQDPEKCVDVLTEFPRFKDVKGLIEQDFTQLFGSVISAKFLERWPTAFKHKIVSQSKCLHPSPDLQELIDAAESAVNDGIGNDAVWDHDLAGILLLLRLIPPAAQGRKRPGKMSAFQAEKQVAVFLKTGNGVQEHLETIQDIKQPYLLVVGPKKNTIQAYYIILDKQAIPCISTSAVGAFDELFKSNFVFGTSYNKVLHNMYIFIQTTIYEIDIGQVKETPRVSELRARLLN
ncbi:hypothetical protein DPEC_G00188480 [Dallia pectoralis]|uniref:Uncharacterized protein n=1 Tax=Dallia pectoralis TaxID=75939 RepID=A0ACC2GBQ7_DALPE|nr:hypothetical protein DPEC_G00188480 [Dallia pectoralis]